MAVRGLARDPEILFLCRDVSELPTHLLNRAAAYVPRSPWTLGGILEGSVALVPLANPDQAGKPALWERKKVFFDAVVAVGTGLEVGAARRGAGWKGRIVPCRVSNAVALCLQESVAVNDACRSVPVPFFWLRDAGQIVSLFVDPGTCDTV